MGSIFSCERITKSFQNIPTIEDISLSLGEGRLVSLLGVSGVGKTTLFNVLAGVDAPDEGHVFLDGEDVTGMAGRVSYMLQKDLLLPHKHVIDNACLALTLRGVPKQEARARAAAFFPQFGLNGAEHKYPAELSGGMRQRAALLRTHLIGNPVILLDEPFSALDAITKASMHKWYLAVMRELHLSTLFITHDIDEALTLSDKIYIMSGAPGKITRELELTGKPDDFGSTEEFLRLKREILNAIEL